jgi:hypothetical protein
MGVCVEDLELLFSVIAGPCLDDPHSMVCGPYVNGSSLKVDVSTLRIKGYVVCKIIITIHEHFHDEIVY